MSSFLHQKKRNPLKKMIQWSPKGLWYTVWYDRHWFKYSPTSISECWQRDIIKVWFLVVILSSLLKCRNPTEGKCWHTRSTTRTNNKPDLTLERAHCSALISLKLVKAAWGFAPREILHGQIRRLKRTPFVDGGALVVLGVYEEWHEKLEPWGITTTLIFPFHLGWSTALNYIFCGGRWAWRRFVAARRVKDENVENDMSPHKLEEVSTFEFQRILLEWPECPTNQWKSMYQTRVH